MPFKNREKAGQQLALRLKEVLHLQVAAHETVVVAIPRGGVRVADPVARFFHLPMDVLLVRRLNVGGLSGLRSGSLGVVQVLDEDTLQWFHLSGGMVDEERQQELQDIEHHDELYHRGHPPLDLKGKKVILIDDGMDCGITMQAAVQTVRFLGAIWVVVAVPYSSPRALKLAERWSDALVCLEAPEDFRSVGDGYLQQDDPSDGDIQRLLHPTLAMERRKE